MKSKNAVDMKYESYPLVVKQRMLKLRELIIDIATKDSTIDFLGEDLKWGEPSFLTKSSGSTLRIDWKEKNSEFIGLYVNCQTKLISIFKELYPEDFEYIGNREVRIPLKQRFPKKKLSKIIHLTLSYNLIKNDFL